MKPLTTLPLVAAFLAFAGCSSPPSPEDPAPAEVPVVEAPPPAPPAPTSTVTPRAPTACGPLVPRTTALEVAVLPDAGATPYVTVLARATRTIRVMVYEMGTGPILDTLVAKARAGVKVQVILDVAQQASNQKYMTQLQAAGAQVIWSDTSFQYMHAKVLVVDEADSVVSTGNYGQSFMMKERNFAVRDADVEDVAALVALFDADFNRRSPDLTCTRLLVSPVNSKQRILDFIASAKTSIVVESMQLADTGTRDALAARKAAGVDVRVLLADPGWITANTDAAAFLAAHDIPARSMKSLGVHVKAIVVDGATAYAGSENLSWTSLTKNREVGLLVTEADNVSTMSATFEKDWATATPF
jgi:phosphatidylserine/phosphatidylglycerophosphate/cardiolipin synthase-like enzyme